MTRKPKMHNAHMLLPKQLWERAAKQAADERTTVTALVCEGLETLLESRKENRRGK
jgi:hypothetical protein